MNENRCPSMDITGNGQTTECMRYLGHVESTDRTARWHVGATDHRWHDADECVESPPKPVDPKFPWAVVAAHGGTWGNHRTRITAEAQCPPGGRVMRLVDADAMCSVCGSGDNPNDRFGAVIRTTLGGLSGDES